MRRCLILYGLTCVVTLTLLTREIALLFGGVELVLIVALGAWLALTGLGCGLLGRLAVSGKPGASTFALFLALTGLFAPLTLLLVRCAPAFWTLPHDGFGPLLLLSFGALLPIGLAGGFLLALAFVIGLRGGERTGAVAAEVAGFAGAGAFLGGLLVTFVLPDLSATQVLAGIASLHCLAAFFVWFNAPRRTELGWLLIPLVVTCALVAATSIGPVLDFLLQAGLYPGRVLRSSEELPPGRLQAVVAPARTEYYLNGALVGAQGDAASVERRTLTALLAHPAPRRLLLLSAVPNDALAAALKLPWLQVDFLPLQEEIAQTARRCASPALQSAFASRRIRFLWQLDAGLYLQQARGTYDVICMELPSEGPGGFSRFMTTRFFAQARRALAEGGVLALTVPERAPAPDPVGLSAAASLSQTLASSSATLLPLRMGGAVLLLNYPRRLPRPPAAIDFSSRMARWNLRGVALRDADLQHALDPKQLQQLATQLKSAPAATGTAQRPLPYRRAGAAWARSLQAQGIGALAALQGMDLLSVLMALLILGGALALWLTFAGEPVRFALPAAILCSGAAAAATAVAGFLMLVAQCEVAAPELGLLIGTAAAGAGLGVLLGNRMPEGERHTNTLLLLGVAEAVCAALGGAAWLLIPLIGPTSAHLVGLCLLLGITFLAGVLFGARLPLCISIGGAADAATGGRKALSAFAWSCIGAGVAALLCGSLLTPVLGPARTAFAAAFLALAALPAMALSFLKGRRGPEYRQSAAPGSRAYPSALRTTYPGRLR